MTEFTVREREYHCEDCGFLDDGLVPCVCSRGHGQMAYLHRVCEDFDLREKTIKSGSVFPEGE
jgi:hypothetical protein